MHDRCNNPNQKCYKNYGGRGVTYCDRWQRANNFVEDAPKLKGWNEKLFLKHKLQLDKDYLIKDNKLYSPETCIWIDKFSNSQKQPSRQKEFFLLDLKTNEKTKHYCVTKVAREYKISQNTLYGVLHHKKHRVGKYVAWYTSDSMPNLNDPVYTKYRNYGTKI